MSKLGIICKTTAIICCLLLIGNALYTQTVSVANYVWLVSVTIIWILAAQ